MKMRTRLLTIAIGVIGFAACAEKKQLTEMHDATVEMNKTTKDLEVNMRKVNESTAKVVDSTTAVRESTEKMQRATEHVSEVTTQMGEKTVKMEATTREMVGTTAEMCDVSRQGISLGLRRDALKAMQEKPNLGGKMAEAAEYFMSFEYQLWAACGTDVEEVRERLMEDAVAEFMKAVQSFVSDVERPSSATAEPDGKAQNYLHSDKNLDATFNALAAALHFMNRKQELVLKRNQDVRPVTMLSMIEEALREERSQDNHVTPPFLHELQSNRAILVRLLQARHNFLTAIFLSKVRSTNKTWKNWLSMGANFYLGTRTFVDWSISLDRFSAVELREMTKYLREASRVRSFLREVGVAPVVDEGVANLLRRMQVQSQGKGDGAINAARVELVGAIEEAKK